MDFEQALVYELQLLTGLSGKVFPQMTAEDTEPPFVIYISSEGERVMTLSGATDLTELSCEIHCVAETYENLKSLTRAILSHLRGFFQRSIGVDGVYIKSITVSEPTESKDNNTNNHMSSFDIRVRF